MIRKFNILIILNLLGNLLTAQQITYTSVPNIKDTFDYGHGTFRFQGHTYLMRSRIPKEMFFSQLDNNGNPQKNNVCSPKPSNTKLIYYSMQIGSKLFHFGSEEDAIDRRGNVLIYNADLTLYKDSIFYSYPNMEFNVCRYDSKRRKVIAAFSYSIHKDSFEVRKWGIMEFDTFGNPIKKIEMPPIVRYEFVENLIHASDGGYLTMSMVNGKPSFVRLDTSYNIIWRSDLSSTGNQYFTQDFSENLIELPSNKGFVYVGEMKGGKHDNCNYFDSYTSLHFINKSGLITKNYYHNLTNKNCESSRPKGLFLKTDSVIMVFTQRDTTSDGVITGKDSGSSLVIYYNFNQHRATKEIIGGQLLNDKTSWVLSGDNGICFRKHVGKDIDGGFITSGWANINDNNGTSAYLMKTDSCGYTQDHKCKLVYKIDTIYGNTLKVRIIDSLSVLCQPIWTIEGKKYTSLDITHNFSSIGNHTVKLWGFAGSTVDSSSFQVRVDSMNSGIRLLKDDEIKVYPNPTNDYIEISVPTDMMNLTTHSSILLTNLVGQKCSIGIEYKKDKIMLDVSKLPKGNYLLSIDIEKNHTFKVVKY